MINQFNVLFITKFFEKITLPFNKLHCCLGVMFLFVSFISCAAQLTQTMLSDTICALFAVYCFLEIAFYFRYQYLFHYVKQIPAVAFKREPDFERLYFIVQQSIEDAKYAKNGNPTQFVCVCVYVCPWFFFVANRVFFQKIRVQTL